MISEVKPSSGGGMINVISAKTILIIITLVVALYAASLIDYSTLY